MKPKIEVNGNEVHLQVFDCILEHGASRFRHITLRKSDIPDVIEALQSVSGPTPFAPDKSRDSAAAPVLSQSEYSPAQEGEQ